MNCFRLTYKRLLKRHAKSDVVTKNISNCSINSSKGGTSSVKAHTGVMLKIRSSTYGLLIQMDLSVSS